MGVYYKHKASQSIKVPYSFCCEQCMKDSGPLTATITGTAEQNSNFKTLSEAKSQRLNEDAHKALVRELKSAYNNATQKQIFDPAFKDECPHCHQPQSWAIAAMKDDQFTTPVAILIVGAIFSAGCYFFSDVKNLTLSIGIMAAAAVAALGFFLYNRAKISAKAKKASASLQNNLPNIQWNAVQNLLDESDK